MRLIIESNQPVNGLVPHNRQQRCHLNICVWTMRFAQSSAIGPWRRPLPYDASKMRNDLMLLFKLVLEVSVLKYPPKLSKKDFYWHIWDEKENIRAYQILKYNKKSFTNMTNEFKNIWRSSSFQVAKLPSPRSPDLELIYSLCNSASLLESQSALLFLLGDFSQSAIKGGSSPFFVKL